MEDKLRFQHQNNSISKMEKQEEIKGFFHELKLNYRLDSESEMIFVKACRHKKAIYFIIAKAKV